MNKKKTAKRDAEIKTGRETFNLYITSDEHALFVSTLPSGWLVQEKINQAVWDSLSDSEKQARTEQSLRDQAKAEQLWRELADRTNKNFDQHKYNLRFSDAFDKFRSAYAVANTGTEKLKTTAECLSFIAGTPPKLAEGSLDADYLCFLGHAYVIKWLVCAADEHYEEPLLKDLAMRMNSAFLAFFDTQMSNTEAEKGSALTETDRKDLTDRLLKSFSDYIDAEFPCEPVEAGDEADEVVEEHRPAGHLSRLAGRPPTFDAEELADLYCSWWPNHHRGEPYTSRNMDMELVKRVKRAKDVKASDITVYRAIQRVIAYRAGEEIYPVEIVLSLNKRQMAAVSALAQKRGHDPAKLSPKEAVRAALGLKTVRVRKRT